MSDNPVLSVEAQQATSRIRDLLQIAYYQEASSDEEKLAARKEISVLMQKQRQSKEIK